MMIVRFIVNYGRFFRQWERGGGREQERGRGEGEGFSRLLARGVFPVLVLVLVLVLVSTSQPSVPSYSRLLIQVCPLLDFSRGCVPWLEFSHIFDLPRGLAEFSPCGFQSPRHLTGGQGGGLPVLALVVSTASSMERALQEKSRIRKSVP